MDDLVSDPRLRAERFERAFADAPIGMALVGLDGGWLRVNRALLHMLGYDEPTLLAKTFQDITHPDDLEADLAQVERLVAGEIDGYQMEKRYFTASGHTIWILLSVSLVRDEHGAPVHFVSHIMDVSERKRLEERLHRLADHDALTGAWNRRRFDEELARQVARCQRYGERAALIALDLDGLKAVNDALGHRAGDDLLVEVTRRLQSRLRSSDSLARPGGDEFLVLLPNVSDDAACRIAEELRLIVEGCGPLEAAVSLSAGWTVLDEDASSAEAAMADADAALYRAKADGRNRVVGPPTLTAAG